LSLREKISKMENEEQLIDSLKKDLQIDLATKISLEKIKEKLVAHIDYLINNNFEELINILYRVDVSEAKLKTLLKENSDSIAANTIADLIIERQLQKIKTREQFKSVGKKENSDEEKW
jgi:Uri superfamily endonuclease